MISPGRVRPPPILADNRYPCINTQANLIRRAPAGPWGQRAAADRYAAMSPVLLFLWWRRCITRL